MGSMSISESERRGRPEHWWIELPNGKVIQTVPGQPLEIGGKETLWHSEGGRDSTSAKEYGQIRIGVQKLLQRHKDVIRKGINKMASKTSRKRARRTN